MRGKDLVVYTSRIIYQGMCVNWKLFFRLIYPSLVGGVLGFKPDHFWKVNGYSNLFWIWGGEDDNMYYRQVFNAEHDMKGE
jgi:hypothetical protein